MEEAEIARVLKRWAKPDDTFREKLLQRCLTVLDQDDDSTFDQGDCVELDDECLDMIAAAGDSFVNIDPTDP
jgi:hypothetical protein